MTSNGCCVRCLCVLMPAFARVSGCDFCTVLARFRVCLKGHTSDLFFGNPPWRPFRRHANRIVSLTSKSGGTSRGGPMRASLITGLIAGALLSAPVHAAYLPDETVRFDYDPALANHDMVGETEHYCMT